MIICLFESTAASCLIPPPKRLPIPAAMIRRVVEIMFIFILSECNNTHIAFLFKTSNNSQNAQLQPRPVVVPLPYNFLDMNSTYCEKDILLEH